MIASPQLDASGTPSATSPVVDAGTTSVDSSLTFTGASCDDGNPCTIDVCGASGCEHTPVVCAGAAGACQDAPTCDPETGACMPHPKADGVSCDDGDACTMNDVCNAGACTAGAPKTCEGSATACTEAPSCDPTDRSLVCAR